MPIQNFDSARRKSLFETAVELPAADRDAFLMRECTDHPELLAELRELLAADEQLGESTVEPLARQLASLVAATAPGAAMSGLRVGPYVLREELGRGGMGAVYRGERVDGNVSQQVAIKFVRRELLDDHTRRRFLLERQTLAALDHPNIARLLDAAELADGSPYFVMEFVAGQTITEHCARALLDVRQRVALMRTVCAAVAHAHRNLIVHRDLKPGNLLVNAEGQPKLLDFGIAKPLDAETSAQTGTAERIFSPHYAAPEQLLGSTVGVAVDVYALGLLLYEVLAGSRPFDFTGLSAGQVERLVSTVPPAAPSLMALKNGQLSLSKQLRGDLDGIVLRCLRKAPTERYGSVEQLEADLANYLEGRPVQARGGQRWYRLQKFIGRNRVAVAASLLLALALIGGLLAFAWQAQIARQQARLAEQRAAELQQVSNFQAEMLGQVDPNQAGQLLSQNVLAKFVQVLTKSGKPEAERNTELTEFTGQWQRINATDTARELIDSTILKPAVSAIDKQFKEQPLVDAALRQVLADRYREMGLHEAAQPLQERALEVRRRELGNRHPDTLASIDNLIQLLIDRGRSAEAEPYCRDLLEFRRKTLGDTHPDYLDSVNTMAMLQQALGHLREAESYQSEALQKRRRALGADHPDTLTSLNNMALFLESHGKPLEALEYYREALQTRSRVLGAEHRLTLSSINNLCYSLIHLGKFAEADPYCHSALEKRRRVLGENHPDTITSINGIGAFLEFQGKFSEAEPYRREALAKTRMVLGEYHSNTITAGEGLASVLDFLGKAAEAEFFWRDTLAKRRLAFGENHPDTLRSKFQLGIHLQTTDRISEADALFVETLEQRKAVLGIDHPDTLRSVIRMGKLRTEQGRFAEAIAILGPAEAAVRNAFAGPNARNAARYLNNLGTAHARLGQFAIAERKLLDSHEIYKKLPVDSFAAEKPACEMAIAQLYAAWHQAEPAQGYDRKAREWEAKAKASEPGQSEKLSS